MQTYHPELEKDLAPMLNRHAIDRSEDLEQAFSDLVEENRLLQIGVVGRVKAGKSSCSTLWCLMATPFSPGLQRR